MASVTRNTIRPKNSAVSAKSLPTSASGLSLPPLVTDGELRHATAHMEPKREAAGKNLKAVGKQGDDT